MEFILTSLESSRLAAQDPWRFRDSVTVDHHHDHDNHNSDNLEATTTKASFSIFHTVASDSLSAIVYPPREKNGGSICLLSLQNGQSSAVRIALGYHNMLVEIFIGTYLTIDDVNRFSLR